VVILRFGKGSLYITVVWGDIVISIDVDDDVFSCHEDGWGLMDGMDAMK
jgi:hypothetical protein